MSGAGCCPSSTPTRSSTRCSRPPARSPARATPRWASSTRDRRELDRFITRGIDADTHRAIGDLPRGRGILGVLIDTPAAAAHRRRRRAPEVLRLPARPSADVDLPRRARASCAARCGATSTSPRRRAARQFDAADEESVGDPRGLGRDRDRERAPLRGRRGAPRRARAVLAAPGGGALDRRRGRRRDGARPGARAHRQARPRARRGAQPRDPPARGRRPRRGRERRRHRARDRRARADRGLDDRPGARRRATCGASPTSAAAAHLGRAARRRRDAQTALLAPLVYRGRGLGVLAAFDHGADAVGFSRGRRGDAAGVRRQRARRRSRSRRPSSTSACATRSRPRRPSAGAGRASCTTRRCRASAACA